MSLSVFDARSSDLIVGTFLTVLRVDAGKVNDLCNVLDGFFASSFCEGDWSRIGDANEVFLSDDANWIFNPDKLVLLGVLFVCAGFVVVEGEDNKLG